MDTQNRTGLDEMPALGWLSVADWFDAGCGQALDSVGPDRHTVLGPLDRLGSLADLRLQVRRGVAALDQLSAPQAAGR